MVKVGDIFPVTALMRNECGNLNDHISATHIKIKKISNNSMSLEYRILDSQGDTLGDCNCVGIGLLTTSTTNMSNMNLIEKAKLAFKGEPEKSFIKAGVMDSNENLTQDGQALFLTYLLKKNGEDFKTTVIDPILKEDEAAK